MTTEEMKALLETPLDPDLDYFDATTSIEALAEHLRGLHKLIVALANGLVQRGLSIIELRQKIIELEADMLAHGVAATNKAETTLVGFDKPQVILPN